MMPVFPRGQRIALVIRRLEASENWIKNDVRTSKRRNEVSGEIGVSLKLIRVYSALKMSTSVKFLSLIRIITCILAAFAVLDCLAEPRTSSTSGYTEYTDKKLAFKIHTDPKTWLEAKQVCADEGGSLAFIDTRKKIRFLASKKSQGLQLWVGISRTSPSKDWSRVDCDDTLFYLPWAPFEPSNSQNCVAIKGCNGGLSSQNCFDRKAFVCEKGV